jgi:hypothetical protein
MALKPDRNIVDEDISFFAATGWAYGSARGGIVVPTGNTATGPSGAAMDQSANQVWYGLNPTGNGQPLGVLMNDVVNIDLTRQTLNPYKSEAQVGDKVLVARKGYVVTNMIYPSAGLTVGGKAYLGPSGYITPSSGILPGTWGVANLTSAFQVGKFLSLLDEDGYAKVYIDL